MHLKKQWDTGFIRLGTSSGLLLTRYFFAYFHSGKEFCFKLFIWRFFRRYASV